MSDTVREYRVVDGMGETWDSADPLPSLLAAESWAVVCAEPGPRFGPFTVESRTVTDWLATEQPADGAAGCVNTEASAP